MTLNSRFLNRVTQGDCLDVMREITDNSVDLIVIDPPYNIGKDKRWDKWKNVDDYITFMTEIFCECERVLKNTGSFYWFHNDMTQIRKLMDVIDRDTSFIYKQFIVWNKRFNGASNKGFLDGFVEVNGLRNYQQMAEYCLFYTFQDETGLTRNKHSLDNFTTLRDYFRDFQKALGMTKKAIIETIGQCADHCFRWNSSQWDLPTPQTYDKLLKLPRDNSFKIRDYEDLRTEFESLRYTFNNQKTHHSVWNYEIAPKIGHITPKPIQIIENIILHSSNEGDIVLDCFLGSGTTAIAAIRTNRQFIGIEREPEYVKIANERIENEYKSKEAE